MYDMCLMWFCIESILLLSVEVGVVLKKNENIKSCCSLSQNYECINRLILKPFCFITRS